MCISVARSNYINNLNFGFISVSSKRHIVDLLGPSVLGPHLDVSELDGEVLGYVQQRTVPDSNAPVVSIILSLGRVVIKAKGFASRILNLLREILSVNFWRTLHPKQSRQIHWFLPGFSISQSHRKWIGVSDRPGCPVHASTTADPSTSRLDKSHL